MVGLCFCQSVYSVELSFTEVPKNWHIENRLGNTVKAYFTGTNCVSGKLRLGASATDKDKDRFWFTVMAAKLSSREIIIYYDASLPDCQLTRFRLK